MRARTSCLAILSILVLAGCSGKMPTSSGRLQVVRDTVGDIIVVRTVSGSVWGAPATLVQDVSIGKLGGDDPHYLFGDVRCLTVGGDGTIYVLDAQAHEVRAFGPDGKWLRTMGREGHGPGELSGPQCVAVLRDGRVLVRDPGNGRIQVYGPDGEAVAEWPVVRGGMSWWGAPLWRDRNDNVYIQVILNPGTPAGEWRLALVRIGPHGAAGDTLPVPHSGYAPPQLEARSDRGSSAGTVPFAATEVWTFSPDGYFVHAVTTDYRLDLLRTGAPTLRIERVYRPVPVPRAQKEMLEEQLTRTFRRMQPDWRWNGPPIPDDKPPFQSIHVGQNGRIWVLLHTPSVEKPNPSYDSRDPDSQRTLWTEPVAFDVFQPDGTYDGEVRAPSGFSPYPTPFFRSDTVWAVTRDSLGVERVARFHVQHGGG